MKHYTMISDCFRLVLEKALLLRIVSVEDASNEVRGTDERAVASLDFSGDVNGSMVMSVPVGHLEPVAKMFLQKFAMDIPMDSSVLFPEMLNIYAGHLVTEMRNLNFDLTIAPPHNFQWEKADDNNVVAIKMLTDNEYMLKFYFYFVQR